MKFDRVPIVVESQRLHLPVSAHGRILGFSIFGGRRRSERTVFRDCRSGKTAAVDSSAARRRKASRYDYPARDPRHQENPPIRRKMFSSDDMRLPVTKASRFVSNFSICCVTRNPFPSLPRCIQPLGGSGLSLSRAQISYSRAVHEIFIVSSHYQKKSKLAQ